MKCCLSRKTVKVEDDTPHERKQARTDPVVTPKEPAKAVALSEDEDVSELSKNERIVGGSALGGSTARRRGKGEEVELDEM